MVTVDDKLETLLALATLLVGISLAGMHAVILMAIYVRQGLAAWEPLITGLSNYLEHLIGHHLDFTRLVPTDALQKIKTEKSSYVLQMIMEGVRPSA